MKNFIVLVNCKDQPGIIAATTNFILSCDGNITYVDQHVDHQQGVFFMRLECTLNHVELQKEDFVKSFNALVANKFQMDWKLYDSESTLKMALFVSKYDHCLYDIIGRFKSGELKVNIPFIVSNHKDLEPIADSFGIPFFHVPVSDGKHDEAQLKHLELLNKYNVDFIVLARYMQIIPKDIIAAYPFVNKSISGPITLLFYYCTLNFYHLWHIFLSTKKFFSFVHIVWVMDLHK